MFTSRAEHRLLLREDNADLRLTEKGRELGLIDDVRWKVFSEKKETILNEEQRLKSTWVIPNTRIGQDMEKVLEQPLSREYSLFELLKRPKVTYRELINVKGVGPGIENSKAAEQLEIQAKYAGYIERQYAEIARQGRYENLKIPQDLNYYEVHGLSTEVRQNLNKAKPATLGIASRIPGITPAAISVLLVHLKK